VRLAQQTLAELLSAARRAKCADLPDAVWSVGAGATQSSYSGALVEQTLPFAAVWQAVLPGLRAALRAIDGTSEPALRLSLGGGAGPYTPPSAGSTASAGSSAAFYFPNATHIRKAAGLPANDPSLTFSPAEEGKDR
jgi:hypothetical protein